MRKTLQDLVRDCFRWLWPAYALASGLILWGFTWSLPDGHYIDKSFHPDENAAVWAVNQIHPPGFNPHWFNWGTAVFYPVYLLKTVESVGGLRSVGDTQVLLAGRLVVWISALGAITFLFLLCRRLFDAPTGRLAAILLAVMPGFIINSHYFKMDIPMTCWVMAAMLAGYRLIALGKFGDVCLLGFLVGYASSTKYNAAAVFPAGLVFIAMSVQRARIRAWVTYGALTVAGFLFGTPRILPHPQEFLSGLRAVAEAGRGASAAALAHGPAWIDYLTRISRLSMTTPLWIAALIALVWLMAKRGRQLLPIWTFLAAYLLILSADNVRLMRYETPLLPFAALAIAALVRELRRTPRWGRLAMPAVGLLAAYSFLFTVAYVRAMTLEDPRVQAGKWIAQNVSKDQLFPVSTNHYIFAPQVYLWGYQKLDVGTDVKQLQAAASPYLAVSEVVTQRYEGVLDSFPAVQQFFDYIQDNYVMVAHFENSQQLLGINSKDPHWITNDWLYPNPGVTIYRRKTLE